LEPSHGGSQSGGLLVLLQHCGEMRWLLLWLLGAGGASRGGSIQLLHPLVGLLLAELLQLQVHLLPIRILWELLSLCTISPHTLLHLDPNSHRSEGVHLLPALTKPLLRWLHLPTLHALVF
jgi:hypothetical protein